MTIKGFVARDKNETLWFHFSVSKREKDLEWCGSNYRSFQIYDFDFPEFENLTWEDEPVKVELTIKKL